MTTTTNNETQAVTSDIKSKIRLIAVDGWNQSLVDRLEQFKYADPWTAAAVHDCIGYSVMARTEADQAVVLEIITIVIDHMPQAEREELRAMSADSLKWADLDSECIRIKLHQIAAN